METARRPTPQLPVALLDRCVFLHLQGSYALRGFYLHQHQLHPSARGEQEKDNVQVIHGWMMVPCDYAWEMPCTLKAAAEGVLEVCLFNMTSFFMWHCIFSRCGSRTDWLALYCVEYGATLPLHWMHSSSSAKKHFVLCSDSTPTVRRRGGRILWEHEGNRTFCSSVFFRVFWSY